MTTGTATELEEDCILSRNGKRDLVAWVTYFPIEMYLRWIRPRIRLTMKPTTHFDPVEPAHNFQTNMKHMHAICKARGIRFYAALQPMNGEGTRKLTRNDGILLSVVKNQRVSGGMNRFAFFQWYYREIRSLMRDTPYFVDLTGRFDGEIGQVFFDTVHFSDRGQSIIAESLADTILEDENS